MTMLGNMPLTLSHAFFFFTIIPEDSSSQAWSPTFNKYIHSTAQNLCLQKKGAMVRGWLLIWLLPGEAVENPQVLVRKILFAGKASARKRHFLEEIPCEFIIVMVGSVW